MSAVWGGYRLAIRMLLTVLLPLTLVAVALGGFLAYQYARDLTAADQARSAALAGQTRDAAGFALFVGNQAQLRRLAEGLRAADPRVHRVRIVDVDGVTLAESDVTAAADPGARRAATLRRQVLPVVRDVAGENDPYGGVAGRGEPAAPATLGRIEIDYDDGPFQAAINRLHWIIAAVALLAVIVASVLALALARSISRPMLAISRTVARISAGDLAARVPDREPGALGDLVNGINQMAFNLATVQEHLRYRVQAATAEMRAQRDQAEHATQAKSRFLAAASHDLRQPLQALGLFVNRLKQAATPLQQHQLASQIDASVRALQERLGSLLDLSQLDADGIRVQSVPFAVRDAIHPVFSQLRPLAEARGLRLRCRGGRYRVVGDLALLERIVLNLVSNAIKYTERGGALVTVRRRGDRVRVAVWDTGVGIAEDDQAIIFDEYVQVGNPERNADKGVGIGLSICRRLAHAMGTTIGMRSRPGRGSVFWLELPAAGPAAEVPATTGDARDTRAVPVAPTIVIDPDGHRGVALADRLRGWGSEVTCASDGPTALAALDGLAGGVLLCHVDAGCNGHAATLAACIAGLPDGVLRVSFGAPASPGAVDPAWQTMFSVRLGADAPAGRLRALLTRPD